ncbi:MAG: glycosyl hydrolase [Verrucomicrobia bacterium]|nr:MAG: glycosyl hydrolase [Verrucomicrobiota bacterium]
MITPNYRSLNLVRIIFAVSVSIFAPSVQSASSPTPTPPGVIDEKLFNGMRWRQVGPFRGGRVLAIEGVAGEPDTYYFGAVAGGVWKTTDGGANWTPLFDKQPISSIGAIAVAPSDHNVIYSGTGEAAIRGNSTYGTGVFKSMDGGKTWENVDLKDTRQIGALVVDPRNENVVLVAALGHAFGPNQERGIFRTTDGGKTWTKVLSKDENTGGIDVVFDPHNPNIVFASLWQARRQPWFFSSGGPGSGLYRSEDNGATWKHLEGNGLPSGILGKIGIAVSGADANRVYAIIEAKEGGLFRSDDAGQHWTRVNDDGRFRQRAWYFSKVYADPKSADTVYLLNTGLFKSVDGGKTFNLMPARHGDHHGLWIDPTNPNRIANANDGGASISTDGGKNWFPYHIYGAQQDNSNVGIASRSDSGVIGRENWFVAGGGECGFVVPDPRDWHIIYSNNEGFINRYDKNKEEVQDVSPVPLDNSGHGAVDLVHRFQWVSPLMLSPHNPDTAAKRRPINQ